MNELHGMELSKSPFLSEGDEAVAVVPPPGERHHQADQAHRHHQPQPLAPPHALNQMSEE